MPTFIPLINPPNGSNSSSPGTTPNPGSPGSPGYGSTRGEQIRDYSRDEFMNFLLGRIGNHVAQGPGDLGAMFRNTAATPSFAVGQASATGLPIGFANLLDILSRQGKTDPAAMNQTISGINRGTQAQQDETQGRFAAAGMDQSGVNQAVQAAQGAAGVGQVAQVRANEAQQAESRSRSDIQLMLDALLNPAVNMGSIGLGQGNFQAQLSNQGNNIFRGGILDILGGGLGSLLGGD